MVQIECSVNRACYALRLFIYFLDNLELYTQMPTGRA